MLASRITACAIAAIMLGCARTPGPAGAPATPVPATPAAAGVAGTGVAGSLTGRWDFRIDVGSRVTPGELWLWRRGDDYTGTVTPSAPSGTNTLPVRSLTVRAGRVAMTVDTPEGPVTFAGTLAADGASMQGTLTYHQGQRFPMHATRRQTGGA